MNYIPGGELFKLLQKQTRISEKQTMFYTFNLAIAIQYLHSHNIIYRDLKSENVLIDEKGYLVLTDFGISKILKDQSETFSFCGTPEYTAPEL